MEEPWTEQQSITYAEMGLDISTGIFQDTVYMGVVTTDPSCENSTLEISMANQTTKKPYFPLQTETRSGFFRSTLVVDRSRVQYARWEEGITFTPYTGVPVASLLAHLPFTDIEGCFETTFSWHQENSTASF